MSKYTYYNRKANRQCIDCGVQDEKTLQGYVRCEGCSKNQKIKNAIYYNEHFRSEYAELTNQEKRIQYNNNNKIKRKQRIKYNFCTRCGKQDAYTLNNRRLCYECCEKARIEYHKNKNKYSKKVNSSKKEKYDIFKKQNKCCKCGRELVKTIYKTCEYCRAKHRIYSANYNRKRGVLPRLNGVRCILCNSEYDIGFGRYSNLCLYCYTKLSESAKNNFYKV